MIRLNAGLRRAVYVALGAASLNLAGATAYAIPIVSPTALAGADVTITFDEVILPMNTLVTDQYEAFGVTFSPHLYYDTLFPGVLPGFPAIAGHRLGSFITGSGPSIVDPFSIFFEAPVVAASVGLATNPSLTRVTAFLEGVGIETFVVGTAATPAGAAGGFLGFTFIGISGIVFDELRIDVCTAGCASPGTALIDHLGYISAVPEPTSLALVATGGLAVFANLRRRRKASRA